MWLSMCQVLFVVKFWCNNNNVYMHCRTVNLLISLLKQALKWTYLGILDMRVSNAWSAQKEIALCLSLRFMVHVFFFFFFFFSCSANIHCYII